LNEAAVSEVSSKLLEVGVVLQGGGALDAMNADALNAHWRRDGFRLAQDILRSAFENHWQARDAQPRPVTMPAGS
jgi:hypothetical protein